MDWIPRAPSLALCYRERAGLGGTLGEEESEPFQDRLLRTLVKNG